MLLNHCGAEALTFYSNKYVGPVVVTIFYPLQPVSTAFLSWMFLQEHIGMWEVSV